MSQLVDHSTLSGKALQPQDVPRGLPNCGIVALAHFTDQPYARALKHARKMYGPTHEAHTNKHTYDTFFAKIGLPVVWEKYTWRSEQLTLNQWVRQVAKRGRRYFVITTGHAIVVMDGYVLDQHKAHPVHISQYHWKRKRVKSWYYIDGEVQA